MPPVNRTMDLTLLETKALVNELFRRFDYVIVATGQERRNRPGENMEIGTAYKGAELACIGLVGVMQAKLVAALTADQPL